MFDDFLNFMGLGSAEGDMDDGLIGNSSSVSGHDSTDGNAIAVDLDGDGIIDLIGVDTDNNSSIDLIAQNFDTDNDGVYDTTFFAMDTDGDSEFDSMAAQHIRFEDQNDDGVADTMITETYMDNDMDGVWDSVQTDVAADTDGNGIFDTFTTQVAVDHDKDGSFDQFFTTTNVDLNEDGIMDITQTRISEDTDGDGIEDYVFTGNDYNNDGILDEVFEYGTPSPDMLEIMMAEAPSYDTFDADNADPDMVIGNPTEDSSHWHSQETQSTCAIASQEFVLEGLTGKEFNEKELMEIAEINGWYEDGTPMECVGNLLDYMGLRTERSEGNGIHDIENCLANGGKVIVGVDGDELWSGESNDLFGPGMDANHAVQVIGINYTDRDNPTVILNDSGVKNGCAAEIPLADFMEAWEDSNYYMIEAYA